MSQCYAKAVKRTDTWTGIKGKPKFYEMGECSRKGTITLVRKDGTACLFCGTHARMAREGYISEAGDPMDPRDRAAFQAGKVKGSNPWFLGVWSDPVSGSASDHPMLDGM